MAFGIDTWAVDFVLLDESEKLIGNSVAYRDSRTDKIMDEVFNLIPKEELYGKTEVIAPIVFRDADILIQNPLSGGKNAVRYEVMDTLIETEHYFLLFTKEWQITIIEKDGMDSGEKDRFLKMMEEKMPGLKRKYGKK